MATVKPDVHSRAALAWLQPRPLSPVLGPLPPAEQEVLRCHGLDEALFVEVLGEQVPRDLVASPPARARLLAGRVPHTMVPHGATALWVHTGLRPPRVLRLSTPHRLGPWRSLDLRQVTLEEEDLTEVAGLTCATVERAAVDVAREDPPLAAVEAIIAAREAGATRTGLYRALGRCPRGSRGAPRARRLIDELVPPRRTRRTNPTRPPSRWSRG